MIRVLFDFLSPYAYIAWPGILALAEQHRRKVEVEPVLLAGLLGFHQTKGPAEVPAKRVYTFKDAYRKATVAGLHIAPPPAHPFNPLLSLRTVLAAPEPDRIRLTTALWRGAWGGEGGVEDAANVARLASEAGLDGPALVERANTPPVKEALKANTERAIRDGAFGVPTFLVDGELFWGTDSLPLVDLALAGNDPITPELVARWADLPATARRF